MKNKLKVAGISTLGVVLGCGVLLLILAVLFGVAYGCAWITQYCLIELFGIHPSLLACWIVWVVITTGLSVRVRVSK